MNYDICILFLWALFAFVWLPLWGIHFLSILYAMFLEHCQTRKERRRKRAAMIRIFQLLKEIEEHPTGIRP